MYAKGMQYGKLGDLLYCVGNIKSSENIKNVHVREWGLPFANKEKEEKGGQ
uniref:hypothetical protein n=1 Tax=Agathobacter sp. TaxID=2021311 RepID=UPI0040566C11